MPTPALTFGGVRYIGPGTRKYYWVPTIATLSAPTRSELNAGTDLTATIPTDGVNGFTVSTNFVDTPDFGSVTVSKIPGAVTLADSSLTFYESSTSSDVRALLTQGLVGYVTIMLEGDVVGQKMNAFKVQVASVSPDQNGGDKAETVTVGFALLAYSFYITIT
jgi:hypothetical protein